MLNENQEGPFGAQVLKDVRDLSGGGLECKSSRDEISPNR
jgi:hypothetical protein